MLQDGLQTHTEVITLYLLDKLKYYISRFVQHDDFFEGIRCMLIDRKDKPKWKYNNPEEIPDSEIESYFKGLPTDKELHI